MAELEFGAQNGGNYEQEIELVRRAMSPSALLDFDAFSCAIRYGEIRHILASQGTPIGNMDLLIAAHASALNATLVTNNTPEFSRVPGLNCENWTTAFTTGRYLSLPYTFLVSEAARFASPS